ncbi:uncharacterized protein [Leptinotarsa decemlineata]|uniref:uncharacterized protein n=1 Tax=Leptinotarsa decemlineata TaxID=7539 RepID=UPI003D3040E2
MNIVWCHFVWKTFKMKVSYLILTVFLLSLSWTASSATLDLPAEQARLLRTERAAPRDLLDVLLNVVVKTQEGRLDTLNENYNKATDRITAFVEWFNKLVGYKVLTVGTTAVYTETTAVIKAIESFASTIINQQFANNAFMKTFITTSVNTALESTLVNLNISLDKEISLDLIKNIIAVTTIESTTSSDSTVNNSTAIDDTDANNGTAVLSRRKRDVGFLRNLLLSSFRSFVRNAFGPIVQSVDYILVNITDTLRSLVNTESSDNPIILVIRNVVNRIATPTANFFQVLHDSLDKWFDRLVDGSGGNDTAEANDENSNSTNVDTDPSEARSFQVESLALEDLDWDKLTPRLFPGASDRGLVSSLTNWLNGKVKFLLSAIISSLYIKLEGVITAPLRIVLDRIVNLILPCTSCISI